MSAGVPHPSGTKTRKVSLRYRAKVHIIHVPADHDGSRVKVEFPDGETSYTEGWNETERALQAARPVLPCPACGARVPLSANVLVCGACGARSEVMLKSGGEAVSAADAQAKD